MADEGHAKIASWMNHHGELAIFRRFGRLNLQNLLYLQAELTHLEADLRRLVERDQTDARRRIYSRDWWYLAQSEEEHDDKEQWDKVLQIREKLKEYNDQLAQLVFLSSLRPPKTYDLKFLHSWLRRPKMGNFPLRGLDQDTWTSTTQSHDLIAIQRRSSSDLFSRWLSNSFIPYFHSKIFKHFKSPIPEDPESEICHYEDGKVVAVVNILSTVMASMLPISSIVILYFVSNALDRLIIAASFTGLFAFCLAVTSAAKRVEIFAATSAFAAVQVVFMAGNNGYIA